VSTKSLFYISLLLFLALLFVYGPSLGAAVFEAKSESRASNSTAAVEGAQFQPKSTLRLRLETEGISHEIMHDALVQALSIKPSGGLVFDLLDEDDNSFDDDAPLMVVHVAAEQLYSPVWARATIKSQWHYASDGMSPSDPEWKTIRMDNKSEPAVRRSSGDIETITTAYGLFLRRYHEQLVANRVSLTIRSQLVKQLETTTN